MINNFNALPDARTARFCINGSMHSLQFNFNGGERLPNFVVKLPSYVAAFAFLDFEQPVRKSLKAFPRLSEIVFSLKALGYISCHGRRTYDSRLRILDWGNGYCNVNQ